ncbi:MAG: hypothetical protein HJJLKODD_02338 [Phycisphaerae bacterium]|nr:hypothetical protein [Phycisphaerae bacterium]
MDKRQLINAIMEINRTARPDFLIQFDEEELHAYLTRLRRIEHELQREREGLLLEPSPALGLN